MALAGRHRREAAAHEAFLARLFAGRARPAAGAPWRGERGPRGAGAAGRAPARAAAAGGAAAAAPAPDPVRDLTFEQALELQDLLIAEYRREDFQEQLHGAWAAAKGERVAELRARQELCLPIQGPVIQRFGFEPTRRGVALSTRAFQGKPWSFHPEIMDRNNMMTYLVNPPEQNTKWINGFEEAPGWWQRSQRGLAASAPGPKRGDEARLNPHDGVTYTFEGLREAYGAEYSLEELVDFWEAEMTRAADGGAAERAPPSLRDADAPASERRAGDGATGAMGAVGAAGAAGPRALGPGGAGSEAREAHEAQAQPATSLDDAIEQLSRLQIMLAVPTVSQIRTARPLRRLDHEIYVAQFVLQSTTRNFSKFLNSEEGRAKFHPFLNPSGSREEDDASFGWLDDKTYVVYQTNGIARTEEPILSRPIKCGKTGAPGHYIETKMLVARRRCKGVPGQYGSGIKAARSFKTREDVEANLFYSWTSCWQIYACAAAVGELGEGDSGERVLIRRSAKDFAQHHFQDFPVAKHLAELLDGECRALVAAFSRAAEAGAALEAAGGAAPGAAAPAQYGLFTLRSWQTYEFEERPPEEDLGVQLVSAARAGHVSELRRLVVEAGCDCDTMVAEFGAIGMGRNGYFTRCDLGFAEERTALIAAVEAGYLTIVEAIIEFAQEGKANLDIVCHEWNPSGIGGECLRGHYTALDQSKLYHRDEIKAVLLRARARLAKDCPPQPKRANPFDVRMRQDNGEYENSGWQRTEHEDRYADFTFVEPGEELQMDEEMRKIVHGIRQELKGLEAEDYNKHFKKLCLRWHPDKHPEEARGLATRVFQWLQRIKVSAWESRAWTA